MAEGNFGHRRSPFQFRIFSLAQSRLLHSIKLTTLGVEVQFERCQSNERLDFTPKLPSWEELYRGEDKKFELPPSAPLE